MLIPRTEPWTREEVERDSGRIYIFGDNLIEKGRGGQACIRGLPNAFGIPTKKLPAMHDRAFFTDHELEANKKAIDEAIAKLPRAKDWIYNPEIGAGLAEMPIRCPKTYAFLRDRLRELS
jgi:hypothetical protein